MSDTIPSAEKQAASVIADALIISDAIGFSGRVTAEEAAGSRARQIIEALAETGYVIVRRKPTKGMVDRVARIIDDGICACCLNSGDYSPADLADCRKIARLVVAALGEGKP